MIDIPHHGTVDYLWKQNVTKVKFKQNSGQILQLFCGCYLFIDGNTGNKYKIASNQLVENDNTCTNAQRSKL